MAEMPEHHHFDLADSRVHYLTAGQGAPLVPLHGWPQTCFAWRKVVPTLARRFRVIAPDLRGLGDSLRPLDGLDKQMVARDIAQLLSSGLGIASAHTSWGMTGAGPSPPRWPPSTRVSWAGW